jgi:hypothetical protein
VPLTVRSYEEVACPEYLAQGRAGGALGAGAGASGIAQKCVLVKAGAKNDSGKQLKDVGVFGLVFGEKDGMSVLGNGQDGKNDAGQFAMIDQVPPGDSVVEVRRCLLMLCLATCMLTPCTQIVRVRAVPVCQSAGHGLPLDAHGQVPSGGHGATREPQV